MNMEVHSAASPQILSLFPQTTIETEQKRDLQGRGSDIQGSGMPGNRSEYSVLYDLGPSMGAFGAYPQENQAYPSAFQVGSVPEQQMYPCVFQGSPADQQLYPSPLAEHEALVANPSYFYSRFNNFHASLGTRLTIPNIGGKELDLHSLYKQVTACGGLDQVIKEKRWKEIATALGFPSSIVNPSFVLRKHYIDLLYHFEQVHYFGAQGQLAPPPGPLPAPHPSWKSIDDEFTFHPPAGQQQLRKKKKKKDDPTDLYGVDPGASVGQIVTGAIDRKFDNGYLVTMVVGSEKLKGVIYHIPTENVIEQYAVVPSLMCNVGHELNALELDVQATKKKERVYKKDPNAPRRSRNGYSFFYVEQLARFKKMYGHIDRQTKRMVVDMWNSLPDDEKLPYVERSEQDKNRYKIEMKAYKEKMKSHPFGEDYNVDNAPEVAGQQSEENGIAQYFNDISCDYHVSLEAETDMTSFHANEQQGIPSGGIGVPVTDHEAYSGEGNRHVYSVQFSQPQISESDLGHSSCLQQTYEASGDHCFYQNQSNVCQSAYVPCSMTSDQMYWMQGGQSYNGQDDGPTLSLYPQNPFS